MVDECVWCVAWLIGIFKILKNWKLENWLELGLVLQMEKNWKEKDFEKKGETANAQTPKN